MGTFNQWAWGSNPHGRTKTATFFGVSQFFVVSTPKRGHEWGFEKRGPPHVRRAKNAVARHFLACGRGPPRAHQKEPCRMLLKSTLQGSFSYAVFRFSVSIGLKLENRFTFCCCVRWTYPYYLSCTMGLSHFVILILYSVYRHARYCGYYNQKNRRQLFLCKMLISKH